MMDISLKNKKLRTIFEEKEIKVILNKRANRIMNRIVISQFLLLFTTASITSLLYIIGLSKIMLSYWYFFIFVLPFIFIVLAIIKRKISTNTQNWLIIFISIIIIWCSITFLIGIFFDTWLGFGKTFWVSIALGFYYISGYFLARVIQIARFHFSKKTIILTVLFGSFAFSIFTLIAGYNSLVQNMKANNIKGIYFEDYGKFSKCLSCAFSVFFMISGICIVISMLLNWALLDGLTDVKLKHNVLMDPPIKLFLRYLSGTACVILICWIFMEFLIPPIPGGGGGSSSGGGGGNGGSSGSGSNKINNMDIDKDKFFKINSAWKSLSFQNVLIGTLIEDRAKIIDEFNKKRKKGKTEPKKDNFSHVNYSFYNKYRLSKKQSTESNINTITKQDWAHIYDKYDKPINKDSTPGERINEINRLFSEKYGRGNAKN